MLTHARRYCLLRFHSLSATLAVTKRASHVSLGNWGQKWKGQFIRSCSTSDVVIANDEKYGNKKVVSLSPRLYDYVLKNVREPEVVNFPIVPPPLPEKKFFKFWIFIYQSLM